MKKPSFDCVISYRMNSQLSGVAKLNLTLANSLNIPVISVFDKTLWNYGHPLFSFRLSDITDKRDQEAISEIFEKFKSGENFSVYVHVMADIPLEMGMIMAAETVYTSDNEIFEQLSPLRSKVIELWSPPLILDNRPILETDITVFCFGMAHKIHKDMFLKLRDLLAKTGKSYSLLMSTAFHESVTFDESAGKFQEIEKIFEPNFFHLGFLSDAAVSHFLRNTTFYAAFFEGGVKQSNSTVNSALQLGAVVITNFGPFSPSYLVHDKNVIDIHQCVSLSLDVDQLTSFRNEARRASSLVAFDKFVERMGER